MGTISIVIYLSLISSFISYEKWVQREKHQNNTHLPYERLLIQFANLWGGLLAPDERSFQIPVIVSKE